MRSTSARPGGVGQQHPCLVEAEHRVPARVGARQAQRVDGEQAQERLADALLLGQL